MSRPRSNDKAIPISVALPSSLVRRLDMELSFKASRSQYIRKAIENRLNEVENSGVETRTTRQLMAALHAREDIDHSLKAILLHVLSNTKQE